MNAERRTPYDGPNGYSYPTVQPTTTGGPAHASASHPPNNGFPSYPVMPPPPIHTNGAAPSMRDQYTYMPLPHPPRTFNPEQLSDGTGRPMAGSRHVRTQSQTGSGHEEVQAGMALANMGMGMSPNSYKARSDGLATPPDAGAQSKKPKVEKDKIKREEQDKIKDFKKETVEVGPNGQPLAKRSCAECRRLKAKCDRQFPCSNCQSSPPLPIVDKADA